jgi:septum formation protein
MAASLWKAPALPVLASQSQTRRQLLADVGIDVESVSPDVDERAIEKRLLEARVGAAQVARELARAKAKAVSHLYPGRWVIAADQTLEAGGEQFHKPSDVADASRQLRALSGRSHELHAAVCCTFNGALEFETVETALMCMRPLSDEFLAEYLALAGPSVSSSVGGYQVEGLGLHLFEAIDGAHSTILGLPLLPVLAFFRSVGALHE